MGEGEERLEANESTTPGKRQFLSHLRRRTRRHYHQRSLRLCSVCHPYHQERSAPARSRNLDSRQLVTQPANHVLRFDTQPTKQQRPTSEYETLPSHSSSKLMSYSKRYTRYRDLTSIIVAVLAGAFKQVYHGSLQGEREEMPNGVACVRKRSNSPGSRASLISLPPKYGRKRQNCKRSGAPEVILHKMILRSPTKQWVVGFGEIVYYMEDGLGRYISRDLRDQFRIHRTKTCFCNYRPTATLTCAFVTCRQRSYYVLTHM